MAKKRQEDSEYDRNINIPKNEYNESRKQNFFLRGIGSVLNVFGLPLNSPRYVSDNISLYARSDISPEEKDYKALESDLKEVKKSLDRIV